jgi:hypothetical protein
VARRRWSSRSRLARGRRPYGSSPVLMGMPAEDQSL